MLLSAKIFYAPSDVPVQLLIVYNEAAPVFYVTKSNCSRFHVVTADIRVHEFFKTSYFKAGIHPIPGARQALQKLSRFCNLSVVTYVFLAAYILSLLITWSSELIMIIWKQLIII